MRSVLVLAVVFTLVAPAGATTDIFEEASSHDARIHELVHRALAARLAGDVAGTHAAVAAVETWDLQRQDAGQRRTGLVDQMRFLAGSVATTRDLRRQNLKAVLDAKPDPVLEKLARHQLDSEDGAAAGRLLEDDRHDRRANLVNDAIRPLGALTPATALVAVNPFLMAGSALDSVVTTAVNLWNYDRLSSREREALARYRTLLERDPNTRDAPQIVGELRRLGAKRAAALCEDAVEHIDAALDAGDLDAARFYVTSASQLEGCDEDLAKPREKVAKALAKNEAGRELAAWPADDPRLPTSPAEQAAWERLLRATAVGDPAEMTAAAQRLLDADDDGPLAPGAQLALAVANHRAGNRPAAREALEELAGDDSGAARIAAAALESPDYSRLAGLDAAETRHSREVAKYVLVGGMDGRSAIYTAAQFGASGIDAAQSFGILNVVGMATRAWNAWRKDPASNQEIIDQGEQFLAREPNAPEAADVHERLSDAYEREGNYERALMHHLATPDPNSKRTAKLKDKLAERLMRDAADSPAAPLLFQAIAEQFPDTDAAEKARDVLKKGPGLGELPLDRALLEANPALMGPGGLDLPPTLLDGNEANGELTDRGVTLSARGLRLHLHDDDAEDDERTEERPLDPEAVARVQRAAEDALYRQLLTKGGNQEEMGRFEKYIPFYVQGSVGEDGVAVVPAIKTRPYRSKDHDLYE
jgi:tetratricopeptide (TPR) repeat protein